MSELIYLCVPALVDAISCHVFVAVPCRSRTREIGIAKRVYNFASLIDRAKMFDESPQDVRYFTTISKCRPCAIR